MINSFSGEYRFLSNFWMCAIQDAGIVYPSVEHAYMANKTEDMGLRQNIAELLSPSDAKRYGRSIQLRNGWEDMKYEIMGELVLQKFSVHSNLKKMLLDTGDQELIEGNTWGDTYWGVCRGKGKNKLGEILMIVREHLK